MTQNEENFINKINELQNVIEWQKKAISQRDDELSIQTSIIDAMTQPKTCKNCTKYGDCNIRMVLINPSLNAKSICLTEEVTLFGCNYFEPKAQ
jgi:hypothetical protein